MSSIVGSARNARDVTVHAGMDPKSWVTGRQPEAGPAEHPMEAWYCRACFGRDAGIIPSKSGNFMLVPTSNDGQRTLPSRKVCAGDFVRQEPLGADKLVNYSIQIEVYCKKLSIMMKLVWDFLTRKIKLIIKVSTNKVIGMKRIEKTKQKQNLLYHHNQTCSM